MHTNGQRLLNQSSATRTHLGCVVWINQYNHTTSIFSFVHGVCYQLIPGCIRNAFCQTVILKHVLDPQIFKSHKAKAVHQFTAFLVSKVLAPIRNALMDMLYCRTALRPVRSSFFCLRKFALRFGKFLFIPAKEPWIMNVFSVGKRSKILQTHIYPYCQFIERQWFGFDFAREASIPVSNSILLNSERLDSALDRPMQDNSDRTHFGNEQTVVQQFKPRLLEGETIVPAITPKAGITRLLTGLHSTKESLESQIDSLLNRSEEHTSELQS